MKEKVVLAYSGGLDTTALIPWLKETFDYEVVCCCVNCGQGNELDGLDERAKLSGASKLYIEDIVDDFSPADLDDNKVEWLDAHPDFSLDKEREEEKKVADAMKEDGWLFASHTWGHQNIGQISLEQLQADTQKFKDNVDPLIGGTDIIIFAFGTDLTTQEDYSGDKFEYLKSVGYNYYCNVDSSKYFVQIRDRYFRQGRRNLDGYRMYYNPDLLEDLFNAKDVFDPSRPTPVPPMG